MEIFKNKFLVKLIATLCLFLALVSFAAPTTVRAEDDGWGGVLITPVMKLLTSLGDGAMELLHSSTQSQKITLIKIDGSADWKNILAFLGAALVAIIVTVGAIALLVATGGAAALIAGALGATVSVGTTITLTSVAIAGLTGVLAGTAVYDKWIPNDIYLPAFSVTAEEIFSNKILLFDVNFFGINKDDPDSYSEEVTTGTTVVEEQYDVNITIYYGKFDSTKSMEGELTKEDLSNFEIILGPESISGSGTYHYNLLVKEVLKNSLSGVSIKEIKSDIEKNETEERKNGKLSALNTIISKANNVLETTKIIEDSTVYTGANQKGDINEGWISILVGTKETGPKNVVIFLDVSDTGTINTKAETTTIYSTAYLLHDVVAKWYFISRNIAILVLMLVLMYTGIRIVLASTAGDKAKYKERLIDWLVAICLVFIMHYIMVFAVEIVDRITGMVKEVSGTNGNFVMINLTDEQSKSASELFKEDAYGKLLVEKGVAELSEDGKNLVWMTDLVGLFRVQSQLENEGTGKWVGYTFAYCALVLFTLFFAWTYLKRIVYMAFLTMIAPLVAMTYPIDKMTDGKAQAFNSWLREYIFNLLIQPMHLLLYSMLVSSAFELATDSPLYALVALGFMMPAEKLIRKFFGFEKASTPGLLGGAAGAALAMTGMNKFLGHRPKEGKDKGDESKDNAKINFKAKDSIGGMTGIAGDSPGLAAPIGTSPNQNGGNQGSGSPSSGSPSSGSPSSGSPSSGSPSSGSPSSGSPSSGSPSSGSPSSGSPSSGSSSLGSQGTRGRSTVAYNVAARRALAQARTIKPNRLKGTLAATGAYRRALGRRLGNKIANGDPIKSLAKGVAGLAGAATFGAAGLAMGIVSGDPSKAFQYASGGALGGAKLGSSAAGAFANATSVDQEYLKEQYEMAAYGEEYKNHVLEQEKKKMQEDEKYINYLQKTMSLSREEAQFVLSNTGSDCFDAGITNIEDIATIHKMTQGRDAITIDEAIGAKKFNDLLPSDVSKMSLKKRNEYIESWTKDYEDAGYGAQSGDHAKKSMEYAIKFANTQSSLKKSQV